MNFRLVLLMHVLGMMAVMTLSIFSFYQLYYISAALLLLLLIFQVVNLIRWLEHTNRRVQRMIESIENDDFAIRFPNVLKGDSFEELTLAMNGVLGRFGEMKKQREETLQFLQALMDHVPVSMVVIEKSGNIAFHNRAFAQMMGLKSLTHLDQIPEEENELVKLLRDMEHDEHRSLQLRRPEGLQNRSLRSTRFSIFGKIWMLVSIQNISSELEMREQESWQKLMRVLTHEIMNSATPIVSLSQTVQQLLADKNFSGKEDVLRAVEAINRRSDGLIRFTNDYRKLTRALTVQWNRIEMMPWLNQLKSLVDGLGFQQTLDWQIAPKLPANIESDAALLEQVFINLCRNAIQAMEDKPDGVLKVECLNRLHHLEIKIQDNGNGIPEEDLDRIFVPFYTTKEEGSGIGLSLSRQIIRQLGGSLRIESKEGVGTTAIVRLPI